MTPEKLLNKRLFHKMEGRYDQAQIELHNYPTKPKR